MRRLFFSLKVLPALLLVSFLFAFVNKATCQVSFSITAAVNGNVNTGTFTSTGFNFSSGSCIEEYSFNGKKTHSEVTFTYADGTITAKTHCDIEITGTTGTGTGRWTITKGTGAYAGISGSGMLTFSVTGLGTDENIVEEWSGTLK